MCVAWLSRGGRRGHRRRDGAVNVAAHVGGVFESAAGDPVGRRVRPENVSLEVNDPGPLDDAALAGLKARPDVDGVMALPPGSCDGPCRAALVSVFVANRGTNPDPRPSFAWTPPWAEPDGCPSRFACRRWTRPHGRVRWVVQLWPEEAQLTATLCSSVKLDVNVSPPVPAPSTPPTPPTPPTPAPTPAE